MLAGPNPWKVALLLNELNVPYTTKIYTTPELKQPSFLALNRNGMAPVIDDPNENLLLAEVSIDGIDCTQTAAECDSPPLLWTMFLTNMTPTSEFLSPP